ncbi:MAG: fibronectin type III domain-containing protein, partial [Minisyncoccia bacterium]
YMAYDPLSDHYSKSDIDEVRFSSAVRTADWIKTEYNNQDSPSTFYSISSSSNLAMVPEAPLNLSTNAGSSSVGLSWDTPYDGNSPITDYIVEYKLATEPTTWTTFNDGESTATSVVITGLTNDLEYDFVVAAVNGVGTGYFSDYVTDIPQSVISIFSDDFTGSVIDTSKWNELDNGAVGGNSGKVMQDGGLYMVDSYNGSEHTWGHSSLYTKKTFKKNNLRLQAYVNQGSSAILGYGDYNFQDEGTSAYIVYIESNGNISGLSWENGVFDKQTACATDVAPGVYKMKIISGGFEIYKDNVLLCTHETTVTFNNKSLFLETSGGQTLFDDVSVYGSFSVPSIPEKVTGLTAVGVNKQVLLGWTAPVAIGDPVTDYVVEYKLSSSDVWEVFDHAASSATKIIVNNLQNSSNYDFKVSAVNSAGQGEASDVVTTNPQHIEKLSFVFTGESNSGGVGLNSSATEQELSPRSAVQIMNLTSESFFFEDLQIGVNNLRDHAGLEGSYDIKHGFELGLANLTEEGSFPDNSQVYLIKTGQGGSRVSEWDENSGYWTKFLNRTNAATELIPSQGRQWVVWLSLGINDALANESPELWKTEMISYINRLKQQLPNAIIIMTEFQAMPANSGYPSYNDIIEQLASEQPNVFSLNTDGSATDGENHWSYAGLKTVASGMADITKEMLGLNYPGTPVDLALSYEGSDIHAQWSASLQQGSSEISDYLVEYKDDDDVTNTWHVYDEGVSTETSAVLSGLQVGKTYAIRVSAGNDLGYGNGASSEIELPDTVAPLISNVSATASKTSVVITWETDEPASSKVYYGLSDEYSDSTEETNTETLVTLHSVTISGLTCETTYHFRPFSKDSS